jgi:hypothetical protein
VRLSVTHWSIWRQPLVLVVLIFAVEYAAVAWPLYERAPVSSGDLKTAALLASLSIAYSLLTRRFERARYALYRGMQHRACPNLLSVWTIAAAVLLPLRLAAAVLVVAAIAGWPASNIAGRATPFKYVYSAASAILAAACARLCLMLGLSHQVAILVAVVTYNTASVLLIASAIAGSGHVRALRMYLQPKSYQLDVLTSTIAVAQIELYDVHWPLLWLSLPATIAVQRWRVKADVQEVAADSSSRPMSEDAWRIAATEIVAALPVVAILRVTTADPLAAVAVAQMQAGGDAIGLVGDAGLSMLLLDCPGTSADALATRLRRALRHGGLTGTVAAAAKPRDGESLPALWAVCEAELITRDAASRHDEAAEPEA